MRFKDVLDRVANLAVIAAAGTFIVLSTQGYFQFRLASATRYDPADGLAGRQFSVSEARPTASERAVVLILSTQCKYCFESVPFYRRLAAARAQGKYELVAVFQQDLEAAQRFLSEQQIEADRVLNADRTKTGAPGTPTIFLVDRSGKIESAHIGRLSPASEQQVLASLGLDE